MATQLDIPGYVTGTWAIDTARSELSFHVRQFGVDTVHGRFTDFAGTIVTTEDPADSRVEVVIRSESVDTAHKRRDKHLHTGDFLNTAQFPTIGFVSTAVRVGGRGILVDGDLTARDVTQRITLDVAVESFGTGPDGTPVARFSTGTEISAKEFGVIRGPAAYVISKRIVIGITVEATRTG